MAFASCRGRLLLDTVRTLRRASTAGGRRPAPSVRGSTSRISRVAEEKGRRVGRGGDVSLGNGGASDAAPSSDPPRQGKRFRRRPPDPPKFHSPVVALVVAALNRVPQATFARKLWRTSNGRSDKNGPTSTDVLPIVSAMPSVVEVRSSEADAALSGTRPSSGPSRRTVAPRRARSVVGEAVVASAAEGGASVAAAAEAGGRSPGAASSSGPASAGVALPFHQRRAAPAYLSDPLPCFSGTASAAPRPTPSPMYSLNKSTEYPRRQPSFWSLMRTLIDGSGSLAPRRTTTPARSPPPSTFRCSNDISPSHPPV
mmetsp:Transcript_27467/g.54941  ORF Transcript_27467/g.54941 Transcript_27467/m.54941 type:complete len:313 (+) Transcript_27467:490-1428(+)